MSSDWVCGSNDGSSCREATDHAGLGKADALLLHGLQQGLMLISHLVKLIDSTNTYSHSGTTQGKGSFLLAQLQTVQDGSCSQQRVIAICFQQLRLSDKRITPFFSNTAISPKFDLIMHCVFSKDKH